jgi:protein SCO1/2
MKPDRISLDLIDQDGRPFGLDRLGGGMSLVYFGFLHCRAVCPRSLARLAQVSELLGDEADRFRILYITVDPARDTPSAMKAFLSANYPGFTGLSGSPDAIDAAKASLRIFTRRTADPEDPDGYAVPHTALIYLIDGQGGYVAHFADHLDANAIADRLRNILTTGRI